MGVVYKAQDTRLERTVALKFCFAINPREESVNASSTRRKLFPELDHPNICTVHEFDQMEAGEMYIVMASTAGVPQNKIKRGPVAVEDAIGSNSGGPGLEKAHRRGYSPGYQTC
jgi:hypothetical protein